MSEKRAAGMRLCGETITLFNACRDGETGGFRYVPTQIAGCSWHRGERWTPDMKGGLTAVDTCVVRIPVDADFGGKAYADPAAWQAGETEGRFTIRGGDAVVRGAVPDGNWTPATLKAAYGDCFTVLGVSDNRRAPHGAHWKLVGE